MERDEVGDIPLVSVDALVAERAHQDLEPFLIKIDIEGGESELFSQHTNWIDHFPLLVIELHDWMLPGTANSSHFLKATATQERDFVHVGENIFSIANPSSSRI